MRMIAALILAGLLAVMAYGIFWLVCLNFTTTQLRSVVAEGMGADIRYGTPSWVPDPTQVTMELPAVTIAMKSGPVKEIRAQSLRLSSGFLMRDRWRMALPERVDVTMLNGKQLTLESQKGEVIWRRADDSLTFQAKSLRVLDVQGAQVAAFDDVMVGRKGRESNMKLNLASRPFWNGEEGILSGEITLPAAAFGRVVDLFGSELPGTGDILRTVVDSLQRGNANHITLDNVSFKLAGVGSGAVSGELNVHADGKMDGQVSVTADSTERLQKWIEVSGLTKSPRTQVEQLGVMRFNRGLIGKHPTVTMENMQTTLIMNGNPVGPLPVAMDVVNQLWPR